MIYTRNDWYVACFESELPDHAPLSTRILDEGIVVWRSGDEIVAMQDRCAHRAAALSLGRCEGKTLRCMYHGLLFNASGKVIEIPGQDTIPATAQVKTYPVATRYGWIWVWMGDPAKADSVRLPDLPDNVEIDDFMMGSGALDYATEARLISDNLLDFSHLTYVHAESFQATAEWAHSAMTITPLERGVRAERWIEDNRGPGSLDLTQQGDIWLGYDYLIPGVLVMMSGKFPRGTARRCNNQGPDLSHATGQLALNIQAVTPVSERSARYYFLSGLHRKFGDETARHFMMAVNHKAFQEDKIVIETQQRILDQTPGQPIMPISHDRGVILYNRLMVRLVAEEKEEWAARNQA